MMQPIISEFVKYCEFFNFEPPSIKWFSTLTGQTIGDETPLNADYLGRQILEPVRFWIAMENVAVDQTAVFLEIGPGKSLIGMGREALERPDEHTWLSSLDRKLGDRDSLFQSAVTLWRLGADIDLQTAHADCFTSKISG
jgi:acyl transferase domain-containing protein